MGISGQAIETNITGWVASVRRGLSIVELLIRFKALGFTLVMPLLGATTVSPRLGGDKMLALMSTALCFHLFSYIFNDVIDLPVDRTEPLRASYPLVRGLIQPWQALSFALAQVPLAGAFTAITAGNYQSYAALGASFALMAVYNLWGKRSIFPPLTDAIQGLAWGGLTLYGAAVISNHYNYLTAITVSFVAIFIILINGVHGSLRDLVNDLRCGLRTTAIMLGARPRSGGGIYISRALALYTLALQSALIALPLLSLAYNWFGYQPEQQVLSTVFLVAVALASLGLLAIAARSSGEARTLFVCGSLHLVLSFASLIVLFGFYLDLVLLVVVLTAFFTPLLASNLLRLGLVRGWQKLTRSRL